MIRRLEEYIAETGDADLTIADLAEIAGVSLTTFTRRFRATTGMRPHQYVLRHRIERAQDLLRGLPWPWRKWSADPDFRRRAI